MQVNEDQEYASGSSESPLDALAALREIARLVDVSTISTNAHDWAFILIQIRQITDEALAARREG